MDKKRILELLATIIEVEPNELLQKPKNTKLTDLGLESIQFIQFIVAIEDEFNIEILDSDLLLSKFETIELLYNTLEKYFLTKFPLKKVLICDCDNVLWHGVSGEEDIYINGLNIELQKTIIDLYSRGILICLCSKNQQENIDLAFETLDMPLKKDHILISKINMTDKATNIKEISSELNLSPESFVFIDDTPYEIDLVSSIIPEITTVYIDDSNKDHIEQIKLYFDSNSTVDNRTQQYREQKEREKQKQLFATVEEFNSSLETVIKCGSAVPSQAERIAELSQRTNQFNLANSRLKKEDIDNYISTNNFNVYFLSAQDKYGNMGIVASA